MLAESQRVQSELANCAVGQTCTPKTEEISHVEEAIRQGVDIATGVKVSRDYPIGTDLHNRALLGGPPSSLTRDPLARW
jgi:hypothetical protein